MIGLKLIYSERDYGTEFGKFDFYHFTMPDFGNKRIFVYVHGLSKNLQPMLRVQFGCLYGFSSFGTECDCYSQWKSAFKAIFEYGCGIAILLVDDDGRGIGFENKINFMKLQNRLKKPPIQTARKLRIKYENFSSLQAIRPILNYLEVTKPVILLSNSPQKKDFLLKSGILISNVKSLRDKNIKLEEKALLELEEKGKLLGHFLG